MEENKLNSLTKITTILTCLSLIVGIGIGVIQLKETLGKANQTLDAIKVESLSNVMDILDIHYTIRTEQAKFDRHKLAEYLSMAQSMLNENKTGEQIYYSDTFADFRNVVAHYERLAVLINLKYLEFQIIFDVIAFPDNFWKESRALRAVIADNWNERGVPLSDFLSGFTRLCESYKAARLANSYASGKNMVC